MAQSGKAIDADLAELAAKHHGLIRASDLKTLGIERRVVRNRANLGIVTSLQPHVWLFGQTDATFEQQCRAAVWTSDGVLGGLSALGTTCSEILRPTYSQQSLWADHLAQPSSGPN